jgi:hypothetical protein
MHRAKKWKCVIWLIRPSNRASEQTEHTKSDTRIRIQKTIEPNF